MAILKQRWFLDVANQVLVRDLNSNLEVALPPVTQGDTIDVEIHTVTPADAGGFRYIDPTGLTCRAGIFSEADLAPTKGSALWGWDGTWTPAGVAVTATAETLSTAINALANITSAGGVTVEKIRDGEYEFTFVEAGARELILADAEDAYPSSYSKSRRLIVGDVDTQEVQRVTMRANAAAGQTTWAALAAPVAAIEVLSDGTNVVQKLTFTEVPVGGQLLLDYGDESVAVPTTADAIELRGLLEDITAVGSGNVTVTGDFESGFIIVFGGLTAEEVEELVPDSSGLLGAKGLKAQIEVEGPEVDDLLGGLTETTALFEIELKEDGDPHTLYQKTFDLLKGRWEPESDTRPPADRFLGEALAAATYVAGQIVTAALTIGQTTVDFDVTDWELDDPASLALGLGIMKPNAGADGLFFTGIVVVDADTIRGYLNAAPTESGYTAAVLFQP